ncbi:hypothetical protein PR048_032860 [Dryococelus australis]|uniref:Uncharacterized protein n=1 Tax=Dryococelus australis TaxID=614101 RepID=A0ABQ9G6L2_9NEOP|nr:hypothetical protein PR048_032860 [Dryococelus australis]
MFYGLTTKDCCKLAYETAISFSKDTKDTLQYPGGCSLAHATAFNNNKLLMKESQLGDP